MLLLWEAERMLEPGALTSGLISVEAVGSSEGPHRLKLESPSVEVVEPTEGASL